MRRDISPRSSGFDVTSGRGIRCDMRGYTLSCSTCTLQAACPEVWAGVRLQAGSGGFTGFRTTIRQADVGVWSKAGAAYTLDRCRFHENWIGVLADTLLTGTHPGVIRGSTFSGGGLLAPYAGYAAGFAGVYARDVRGGFELGAVGAANQNLLQGLQNGFYSYRSTATVRNCLFRDMVNVGPLGAISACGVRAIKPPDGDPFVPTIHVGHPTSASLNDLYQHRNVFNNCRFGVMVDSTHHVAVRGNTIRGGTQAGVWVRKQSPLGTLAVERDSILNTSLGIQLNEIRGVLGAVVRGNAIEGNNAVVRRGIRLGSVWYAGLGNFATGLLVEDNTVALRGDGIWAEGCDHVAIDGNSVYAGASPQPWSNRGIFLGGCVDMRVFDNEIFSNRGGALADTSFVGFMGSLSPETDLRCNLIHDVGRCVVWEGNCGASRMYKNSLGRAVDGLVFLNQGEIGRQGSGPPFTINKVTQGNTWGVNQHLRWQVLFSGSNSDGNDSRFFLKQGAANNPSPALCGTFGPGVIGFTKTLLTGNVQIPLCVANLQSGGTGGNITQIANRQLNGGGASFRENTWAWSEVQQDLALLGYDSVIPPYHAGVGPLAPGRLAHAELRLRMGQVQASQALAAGTVPATIEQEVEQQVKLLLASAMSPGFDTLVSGDRNSLDMKAALCPAEDGRGVFLARSLLGREGVLLWEYDDCPVVAAKMDGGQGQGAAADIPTMWPNPSDRSVNVQLPVGDGGLYRLEVVSLFGQQLMEIQGSRGELLEIGTADLPASTYLLRVTGGGGSWQFRLVVVH